MKRETLSSPIKVYTPAEAAAALRVTMRTMQNYIKNGTVKATMIGGRWKIAEDDLLATIRGTNTVQDPTGEK